jgi:hypothetical protein
VPKGPTPDCSELATETPPGGPWSARGASISAYRPALAALAFGLTTDALASKTAATNSAACCGTIALPLPRSRTRDPGSPSRNLLKARMIVTTYNQHSCYSCVVHRGGLNASNHCIRSDLCVRVFLSLRRFRPNPATTKSADGNRWPDDDVFRDGARIFHVELSVE